MSESEALSLAPGPWQARGAYAAPAIASAPVPAGTSFHGQAASGEQAGRDGQVPASFFQSSHGGAR